MKKPNTWLRHRKGGSIAKSIPWAPDITWVNLIIPDGEIRKGTLHRDIDELNKLYLAAAEGRYFCEPSIHENLEQEAETGDGSLRDVLTLHETKHTKKGHDLFVVKIEEQLNRETFIQLKERTKSHNGYYSSYRGHGAIPGFHFLEKELAQSFLNEPSTKKNCHFCKTVI